MSEKRNRWECGRWLAEEVLGRRDGKTDGFLSRWAGEWQAWGLPWGSSGSW